VAVLTGFDPVLADSVVRTDTLVTATRYGVNARDGATFYVRFRLTPGDYRIAGIGAQDAGVAAATPYLGYRTRTPLRLPFAGDWIVFWGGRTIAENYHAAYATQRFALDLVPAADSAVFARAMRGEPTRLSEFACFGHPVLAPAAGVVVTAVDSVPDHPAGTLPPFVGWGNHVVIDHGTGEFSMFDHLKQGSVPVRPGARVAAGAVVGACGNSGRATHPGLHYDLLTRPAEGRGTFSLPAQFLDYTANGRRRARGAPPVAADPSPLAVADTPTPTIRPASHVQTIPRLPHGADQLWIDAQLGQLAAQLRHVRVHRAGRHGRVVAPHVA
jgi:hypothetical protein